MLFEEGDAALLKKWIVKRLEDMYALPINHLIPIPYFIAVRNMVLMV